jgi:hypothetical protein
VYCIPLAEVIRVETSLARATPDGVQEAKGRYLRNGIFTKLVGK